MAGPSARFGLTCPACQERLQIQVFPALRMSLRLPSPPALAAQPGSATCFFHPGNSAASPCDACGRFLCGLCDLRFGEAHFCATCLDAARRGKASSAPEAAWLKDRVFLPQNLILALTLYSPLTLLGLYALPLTAPTALWLAFRHRKSPHGFQARGNWRLRLGTALASLQLLILILLGLFLTGLLWKALGR
jgi:hypothetical protein